MCTFRTHSEQVQKGAEGLTLGSDVPMFSYWAYTLALGGLLLVVRVAEHGVVQMLSGGVSRLHLLGNAVGSLLMLAVLHETDYPMEHGLGAYRRPQVLLYGYNYMQSVISRLHVFVPSTCG